MSWLIYILHLGFGFYYFIRLTTCTIFVIEKTAFNRKIKFYCQILITLKCFKIIWEKQYEVVNKIGMVILEERRLLAEVAVCVFYVSAVLQEKPHCS